MNNYVIAGRSLIRLMLIKYIKRGRKLSFTYKNLLERGSILEFEKNSRVVLGSKFSVRNGAQIHVRDGAEFKAGNNVFLNSGCIVTAHEKIEIGNGVKIGPNTIIYDHDHKYDGKEGVRAKLFEASPVIIGDNTWIGAGVIILKGAKIGKNCVIGAGTLIKGDIPDNSFVVQKRETSIFNLKNNNCND